MSFLYPGYFLKKKYVVFTYLMLKLRRKEVILMPILTTSTNTIEQLGDLMLKHPMTLMGIMFILLIIVGICRFIKSLYMLFVVRPKDPELYREYRADRRNDRIVGSLDDQANQMRQANSLRMFDDNNYHSHDF